MVGKGSKGMGGMKMPSGGGKKGGKRRRQKGRQEVPLHCVGYRKKFHHRAYGLRRDGTIGGEEPGLPVAEFMFIPRVIVDETLLPIYPPIYQWTDGTTGPIERLVLRD